MPGTQSALVDIDRFWVPAGESYSSTYDGWLADPSGHARLGGSANALTTDELRAVRCVVLLGEPGMGKSSALEMSAYLKPSGEDIDSLNVNLGQFASEDRLVRTVFENPKVLNWHRGQHSISICLDNFDEAHRRIETLHQILSEFLTSSDCERLYLRIACRAAEWPTSLGASLERHFADTKTYQLLPLRRIDAQTIVESSTNSIDLLRSVEESHLVPLAARPLTLKLLMGVALTDGQAPQTNSQIFERGLLTLVDEVNPTRRDGRTNLDSPSRLLDVASKVAAISAFTGRQTVWIGPAAYGDATDLMVEDLTSASNKLLNGEALVHNILRTAIFTGAGDNRLAFAHVMFTDYLCARWISNQGMKRVQVTSLLLTEDLHVHSRLRQTAAWLVALDPEAFGWLIPLDPEAFLLSVDIPVAELREQLVLAIFNEARSGDLFHDYSRDLSGLVHPHIAAQLTSGFHDSDDNVVRVAVDIARSCKVREVVPELISLALDDSREVAMRVSAAMGAADLSDENPGDGLIDLATTDNGQPDGDYQELQAAGLFASWPHAISTSDVFKLLVPKYPTNFYGLFSTFVNRLAASLTDDDLDAGCAWVVEVTERLDDSRVSDLIDAIVALCIKNIDTPTAQETLRFVVFHRVDAYEEAFAEDTFEEDLPTHSTEVRRKVALVLLQEATTERVYGISGLHSRRRSNPLTTDDLTWLIEQYATATGRLRENIATALNWLLVPSAFSHADAVLSLEDRHPAAALFSVWRTTADLNSEQANEARTAWNEHQDLLTGRQRGKRQKSDDWVNPRISEYATRAAHGDTNSYWPAMRFLTVRPGTNRYMDEFQPDVTVHPRWQTLSTETQNELLAASATYLLDGRCDPDSWFGRDMRSFVAEAGYRALILLLRLSPEKLAELPAQTWKEWAPILVSWSATINGASANDKRVLFQLAIPHARLELTERLVALIDDAIGKGNYSFTAEECTLLQSPDLSKALVERIDRNDLLPQTLDELLSSVTEQNRKLLRPIYQRWLTPSARLQHPERASLAVARLMQFDATYAWPLLHELMLTAPDFMEIAFLTIGGPHDWRIPNLEEDLAAELYIWLCQHFPPELDPDDPEMHFVGSREAIGRWRDDILNELSRRGTKAAIRVVAGIAERFPERQWLLRAVIEAKRAYRNGAWQPCTIEQLDKLAADRRARLIRTEAELLTATVEALEDIQSDLQGDTPSAQFLWNTNSYIPKQEDEISDFLRFQLHQKLRDRGVIVNREVQVRRIQNAGLPERTDLLVESITDGSDGGQATRLAIPIEVKGAWHPDVETSLRNQLVDRYMADFATEYGLYVVAWFDEASWQASNQAQKQRRSRAVAHVSANRLLNRLEELASEEALRGKHVAVVVLDASLRRTQTTEAAK